ncbi:MAG TPA: hypothetical protein VF719_00230, partial [Abditibacteriaceae bacterium]
MRYIEIRTTVQKKAVTVGLAGLMALPVVLGATPFGTTHTAQAAPRAQAPAYGYRNRDNKGKKNKKDKHEKWHERHDNDDDNDSRRDDRWDRNRDQDRWNNNSGQNQLTTLSGTVVRDAGGDRSFEFRASNGRTYQVRTRNDEPSNLSAGDRVEIRGRVNGNTILADSVRVTRESNSGWNNNALTTLTGTVVRDAGGDRSFEFRASNGRTYQVQTRIDEPSSLS